MSSILAASLIVCVPTVGFPHVGHGDEFQATGGINRVKVNPQTDQLLGIVVTPIASSAQAGSGVMIPVTALVDANGKQIVFVQYENFYEPVEVTTGATKGELIAVTTGLSVGEKLVTQGGLSLYAESRKAQTADTPGTPTASETPTTLAEADNQDTTQQASGLPMGILAGVGGGVVLVGGAIAVIAGNRKNKGGV
ncbi:cobalt transporter [Anabaena sp. CS-542/02]|uniref:cobalt transporter n=1 Tax=Anabaena sp. CS-542/02 TaxID=3021719 RepID=UPI00232AB79B|nr:cobalt transporter [Anabaena sp. CS-542/02]MDB9446357.1 cobalt transporter [Anabaena sp. CS-542/02]